MDEREKNIAALQRQTVRHLRLVADAATRRAERSSEILNAPKTSARQKAIREAMIRGDVKEAAYFTLAAETLAKVWGIRHG